MHVISVRNVAQALPAGVEYLLAHGHYDNSRNGRVLVAPVPVTTVYEHPRERVLLSAVRDANPFFHLAEALWMLAGRNDATFLDNFVKDFSKKYAEDGVMHGAYGHRWRHALGFDQLDHVVETLRKDAASRQCVIQMWDAMPPAFTQPEDDEVYRVGCDDLRGKWLDRPCNTHIYLRVRAEDTGVSSAHIVDVHTGKEGPGTLARGVLDMTVCCRSNDIIMGAYGANAVHMSVLQEYLAARIGVQVGIYYQISNNYHAYENDIATLDHRRRMSTDKTTLADALRDSRVFPTVPLVRNPATFDHEVKYLLNAYETLGEEVDDASIHRCVAMLDNLFLSETAWPMLMAHRHRNDEPINQWVHRIGSLDWAVAAKEWIERRRK